MRGVPEGRSPLVRWGSLSHHWPQPLASPHTPKSLPSQGMGQGRGVTGGLPCYPGDLAGAPGRALLVLQPHQGDTVAGPTEQPRSPSGLSPKAAW